LHATLSTYTVYRTSRVQQMSRNTTELRCREGVRAVKSQVQKSVAFEQVIQGLSDSAQALQCAGGDALDLRELRTAVHQLQHTVNLMARQLPGEPGSGSAAPVLEPIAVPDFDYGYAFWRDADDEGICGHRPAQ